MAQIKFNKTHAPLKAENIIVTQENIAAMSQKYSFLSTFQSYMCCKFDNASPQTAPAKQHAVRLLLYQQRLSILLK